MFVWRGVITITAQMALPAFPWDCSLVFAHVHTPETG
jgi:hypothetical protein